MPDFEERKWMNAPKNQTHVSAKSRRVVLVNSPRDLSVCALAFILCGGGFILSQPSAGPAPVLSVEIGKAITWAKNTSQCKEVCLLLPGERLSSLQLIMQHVSGSGPGNDAKTVERRLNDFLLLILRQCVCVHALACCLVFYFSLHVRWVFSLGLEEELWWKLLFSG